MKKMPYMCQKCDKQFVREASFLAHECAQMIRCRELKTVLGQCALYCYKTWIKNRVGSTLIDGNSFLQSKYYKAFMAFAQFSKELEIVNVDQYIKLMVKNKFSPGLWTHDVVYVKYIQHLDTVVPPLEMVESSVNCIVMFCELLECEPPELFTILHQKEILVLIRTRRLSPWLLLKSGKFMTMLNNLSEFEQLAYRKLINAVFWKSRFMRYSNETKVISAIIETLQI